MLRTVAAPLYTRTTDVYANSVARLWLKVVEIPYRAVTSGKTSFEPLFDVLLEEDVGYLAAGAALLNEHLRAVVAYVQEEVPELLHFGSPPLFSLGHRSSAIILTGLRSCARTIVALPVLLTGDSRRIADDAYKVMSNHDMVVQVERLNELMYIEIPASLHSFLRPWGEAISGYFKLIIGINELLYNTTMGATTGVATPEHTLGHGRCESEIKHETAVVGRIRYTIILFSKKWTERIVPLQLDWSVKVRALLVMMMLLPTAETVYSTSLTQQ
jgi:hypothetical protein